MDKYATGIQAGGSASQGFQAWDESVSTAHTEPEPEPEHSTTQEFTVEAAAVEELRSTLQSMGLAALRKRAVECGVADAVSYTHLTLPTICSV